jgi:glucosamine--fructose-6-phosphate aminotransferase (isomerizing)
MCGIVGYIGHRDAWPVLIKGLKQLEYRGYDSAGIALIEGKIVINKSKGKVADLELKTEGTQFQSKIGIGHTRWATHGEPNNINAHPHYSGNQKLAIIHNGIIENYQAIKEALLLKGHQFESDTDTVD